MAKRTPEAADVLSLAKYRRSMRALGRASESAANAAALTGTRHGRSLETEAAQHDDDAPSEDHPQRDIGMLDAGSNVRSLAAARARRSGHPAGSNRTS